MAQENDTPRGRVIGIGGVFFKSSDKNQLEAWYARNLGIESGPGGCAFTWSPRNEPQIEHQTVLSIFPPESNYFESSEVKSNHAPFMINYIVDDLDAILARAAANGVRIDPKREDYEYGRFAWIFDPDGNKVELWEPASQHCR